MPCNIKLSDTKPKYKYGLTDSFPFVSTVHHTLRSLSLAVTV